jgi:Na+/melibiose symporter-like transporter
LTRPLVRESRIPGLRGFDFAGAATITSSLALLVYGISKAPDVGWSSGRTIGFLVAAALLLVAFLVIESRHPAPMMPFRIFRVRTVTGANVVGFLLGAVVFSNFFLLTLYVQNVLQWSPLRTGLTFVATAGSAVLWAGLAQMLVTKIGPKKVMALGFVATIAGLLWYTQIPVHASYASDLLPGYLLIGFALPFSFIPVSIAALAGVEPHEAGLASGLINTAQQVGGAIGVAVTSSVLLTHSNTLLKQGTQFPDAWTSGTHWGFWVAVGIAVAGLVATLVLIQDKEIATAEHPVAAPG